MNLPELIVASAVFLGACSGAAQMSASSAQAMTLGRHRGAAIETIEAQFLLAESVFRAAPAPEALSCVEAAQWMQNQLEQHLERSEPALQRHLSPNASGELLRLTYAVDEGLQRTRVFSPAAYGFCAASVTMPERDHATL